MKYCVTGLLTAMLAFAGCVTGPDKAGSPSGQATNSTYYFWPPDKGAQAAYAPTVEYRTVRPEESFETLLNPHRGFATFQHFNGDPLFENGFWTERGPLTFNFVKARTPCVDGYLPTTVAYCRWYWDMFEPEKDKFDWSMVKGALKMCEIRGQTLQVRLMPSGENSPPAWYAREGSLQDGGKNKKKKEPVYDEPIFLERWEKVIKSFAKEFANNPHLETMDIAFLGAWGEGGGKMAATNVDKMVDMYLKYFNKSNLVVNIDGYQFASGIDRGTGWRCDCYGDMRNMTDPELPKGLAWNHTFEAYPKTVYQTKGAADRWMTAPVVFETCHNPLFWAQNKLPDELFNLILEQGRKFHCSVFMPKYSLLPQQYMERLKEFEKTLGYRYVLRQVIFRFAGPQANLFKYEVWVENVGVAPIYKTNYRLAFKFVQGNRTEIVFSKQDLTRWLPGDTWVEEKTDLVPGFATNRDLMIYVALVDAGTKQPAIKFAIKDVPEDGWYPLGKRTGMRVPEWAKGS